MHKNYFEESEWARLRAFNCGTGRSMRAIPICAGSDGLYTCLPAEEESSGADTPVWQIGFEWDEPRDIRGVRLRFADGFDSSVIKEQYVQYWMNAWPLPTLEHRAGALRGWAAVDGPFNGSWNEAYGEISVTGDGSSAIFDHFDITEETDISTHMAGIYSPQTTSMPTTAAR